MSLTEATLKNLHNLYTSMVNLPALEIDITDYCEMGCFVCHRGCDVISENIERKHMSVEDIENFIEETLILDKYWHTLRIIGGEPALNPDVLTITKMLSDFCKKRGIKLDFFTHGATENSNKIIQEIQKYPEITIVNTHKVIGRRVHPHFNSPYLHPLDMKQPSMVDSGHCYVLQTCGQGLTTTGYGICCDINNFVKLKGEQSTIQRLRDLYDYDFFEEQALKYCYDCGIPFRLTGNLSITSRWDTFFKTNHYRYWVKYHELFRRIA